MSGWQGVGQKFSAMPGGRIGLRKFCRCGDGEKKLAGIKSPAEAGLGLLLEGS